MSWGYKKVGRKARTGSRRWRPHKSHAGHRKKGGLRDPLTRAVKRENLKRKKDDEKRYELAAENDG